jgi:FixJ family two-component response regulator
MLVDSTPGKRCVVAVVDDDPSVCRGIGRLLRSAGYTPGTYASALDFLDGERRYDCFCLIVDVCMPGMTGLELQQRLSREKTSVPVIVVTARDDPQKRHLAESAGAVAFLGKPIDGRLLLDAVARCSCSRNRG